MKEMQSLSMGPLLHMCNIHAKYDPKWCLKFRADKEGKKYYNPMDLDLKNKRDKKIYDDLKGIIKVSSKNEVFEESGHPYSPQIYESLNKLKSMVTSKHICFSKRKNNSLQERHHC